MRELHWDGYVNARDLGGLPTPLSATGRTAPGRIARGPRRERLTQTGWEQARSWGLKTVIDLRCAYESGVRDHDPQVPEEAFADIVIVQAPTEDQGDDEFRRVCFPILDSPEYWQHNWRILPHLVRQTMEQIAVAEQGVLVHCSAGRDRTGMITALLLGNAGVPSDVVADDYVSSVRAMAGTSHHAPTADRQQGWTPDEVDEWLVDKVPVVRDTAQRAEEILTALGVAESSRHRLRRMLTG